MTKVAALVGEILEDYARRGVFRGFSRGPAAKRKAAYKLLWHRDRLFDLILDETRRTLRFPLVLPDVPPDMYRELRRFVEARQTDEYPAHRRIDPARARIRCSNRAGQVAIAIETLDGDYAYAVRKLIHLVHEIYLAFLIDGPYFEYMVEAFGLDPDNP
jgi:hypothetical protein